MKYRLLCVVSTAAFACQRGPDGNCLNVPISVGAVHTSGPNYTCPDGYSPNLAKDCCVRTETFPSTPVCPVGVVRDDHCCVTQVPPSVSCKDGTVLTSGGCIRTTTTNPTPQCEPPSRLSNTGPSPVCLTTTPVRLLFFCHSTNEVLEGSQCASRVVTNSIVSCPPGWTIFEQKRCRQSQVFDCATMVTLGDPSSRRLLASPHCHPADPTCVPQICQNTNCHFSWEASHEAQLEASGYHHESQAELMQATCRRVITIQATFSCPHHLQRVGNECCLVTTRPADQRCPAEGDVSNCFNTIRRQPEMVCPPNFHRSCTPAGCVCECPIVTPPLTSCPTGSQAGRTGVCEVCLPPSATCPPDATYNDQNGFCCRELRVPIDVQHVVTVNCHGGNCLEDEAAAHSVLRQIGIKR